MVCWLQCEKEQDFPAKMDGSLSTYLASQSAIVSGKPVVSKDQRAGRIKQSNIEVQIHTITGGKYYGQVGNFRDGVV